MRDCARKISKEHYVSKSIVQQIPNVEVDGFPWMKPGLRANYGVESLSANILCTRHNSALSNLDTHASLLFRDLREAQIHAAESQDGTTKYYLYSGDALEKWAAKTMLGLYYSDSLGINGTSIKGKIDIDEKVVARTIFDSIFPAPMGIRITNTPGDILNQGVRVAPITPESQTTLSGVHIAIRGLSFHFVSNRYGIDDAYFENDATYRPWIIDFVGDKSKSRVFLTWTAERTTWRRLEFKIAPEHEGTEPADG